jgi:hypothetical protein
MVRVQAIRELENCLDSAPVKEFDLDEELTVELMKALAVDSILRYYPHFPRPYFRIDCQHAWVIQGIIGSRRLRVTFSSQATTAAKDKLKCLIES